MESDKKFIQQEYDKMLVLTSKTIGNKMPCMLPDSKAETCSLMKITDILNVPRGTTLL
jgi:hypothetical protein